MDFFYVLLSLGNWFICLLTSVGIFLGRRAMDYNPWSSHELLARQGTLFIFFCIFEHQCWPSSVKGIEA
jgi:hypothetical protein